VRNIEYSTEDTMEDEDEQVQESKGEDSGLDTNIPQDSNNRVHPIRGSLCWFNI
jgi:hypothetical protein